MARDVEEPLGIVAKSAAMRQLVDLARRVAKVDSTVLITGESGSGKERIARLVHDESTRAAGPFIAVNCGAITETLLESELFGHARGAFTGATQDRPGLFEAANSGTLLLDEVGECLAAHAGQAAARAAGARDPARRREQEPAGRRPRRWPRPTAISPTASPGGGFRQDLYYRLKVVELHVPPLRERRDDVLPLARVLLADAALRMKRKISGLAPGRRRSAAALRAGRATCASSRTPWSARSRSRAEAASSSRTCPRRSARRFPEPIAIDGTVRPLDEVEKEYILAALELQRRQPDAHRRSSSRSASATLYRKLKSYGLIGKRRAARRARR